MTETTMETLTLKAGTTVVYCGVPIALTQDTEFETTTGNVRLIEEFPRTTPSGDADGSTEGNR